MNHIIKNQISLGSTLNSELTLSIQTFRRHFACFGSSGSGKTVVCKVMIEELARRGIPIIAFDPQGDIASLALIEDENVRLLSKARAKIYEKDLEGALNNLVSITDSEIFFKKWINEVNYLIEFEKTLNELFK